MQYDPQATGVIDYQALMKQLLHSDYYALYLGTVDNTQNTLDATSTFNMITNLKSQFTAQGQKLKQVGLDWTHCIFLVQCRWVDTRSVHQSVLFKNFQVLLVWSHVLMCCMGHAA